jgi:quercetin dioxygenase-like cupin family protein
MTLGIYLIACLLPVLAFAHEDDPKLKNEKPKAVVLAKKTNAATPTTPEYIQLAKNVEVIANVENAVKSSGVLTHEGLFGPLLYAEQTRAFFIELKPGMFLGEHPHDVGSIVYTVRGKWVLASEGKRQVMETGALFRFGDNMPTGWEAPFADGALLLVVKPNKKGDGYEDFNKGLKSMQVALDKERKGGIPFYFNALKPNHPAVLFARSVNPGFDSVLKGIKN